MSENKLFEDMAKLASSAFGTMNEVKKEMEKIFHDQTSAIVSKMDLVTRKDFERLEAMVVKSREEQERILEMFEKLSGAKKPVKKSPVKAAKPKAKSKR